ncbi:hypothetical protein [Arcticibacterium luteifluviistationis]|uniref:Glycine zipper family protein n=1 Tax=Arcticibacterium luteifluviistationis TaxID=1784714 RepID=A0A2Z4GAD5_9BACT|nr:hypothetical protein [Arcticibacterium luteifluviistationis]AWV97883.1 hypothetical protein DJ013_06760 [Arcticibacterium luteifluviistationis]
MKIKDLLKKPDLEEKSRELKQFIQFENLMEELNSRTLSEDTVQIINIEVDGINNSLESGKKLAKQIKTSLSKTINFLEKELKIVTKNHYRNLWLAIGVGAFGVPLGVAFGSVLGNMAFIGIGMPIGMAIGLAIGTQMDKKAAAQGNQLDLEVKF